MIATHFERRICGIIWYTLSGISLFCSLITPYIIYKMRNFNGTLLLVVGLSSTLAIYSFGLLLTAVNTGDLVCRLQGILIFYAGISSALWTTCFSTTLLMLVTGVKFGSIQQIYKYFAGISIGLPLLITCVGAGLKFISRGYLSCFVTTTDSIDFNGIYDLIILICVIYNLFFFVYCWNRIRQMGGSKSPTAKALKEACFRMIYYPLVQSWCWLFIWTRYFHSSVTHETNPKTFGLLLIDCLSSPLFGFGMFAVFLIQQKKARYIFLSIMLPKCVLKMLDQRSSETLMHNMSESSINNAASVVAHDSRSRRNTANNALNAGADPTSPGIVDDYDDDDGIIQIHHDEDSDSLYSNAYSISMVSRPSMNSSSSSITGIRPSIDGESTLSQQQQQQRRNSNNSTATATQPISISNPHFIRTVSTNMGGSSSGLRSPIQQQQQAAGTPNSGSSNVSSLSSSGTTPTGRSSGGLSSILGLTAAAGLFGNNNSSNSVSSADSSKQSSRQDSHTSQQGGFFSGSFLSRSISQSTGRTASQSQSQGGGRTASHGSSSSKNSSHNNSRAVSVNDDNFCLLDEVDLFRILQDEKLDGQ